MTSLSVILPVRDEAQGLAALLPELKATMVALGVDWQIVIVDDGSADGTWSCAKQAADDDARVVAVRLRRRSGKTEALDAGRSVATGDVVVLMDGDGQDVPAAIEPLLRALHDGADLANGWRRRRADPWTRRLPSAVFNALVSAVGGLRLHDHNCGLKAMRREVAAELPLVGQLHRFIPVLAAARGYRVVEVEVPHRPRRFGVSKYGAARFVTSLFDLALVRLVYGTASRFHQVLGLGGLLACLLGGVGLAYLAVLWAMQGSLGDAYVPIGRRPLALYSVALLLAGAQLLTLAYVASLLLFVGATPARGPPIGAIARAPEGDPRHPGSGTPIQTSQPSQSVRPST